MRRAHRRGKQLTLARSASALGALALTATACSTLDIVRGFNVSPHSSLTDPSVTAEQAAARLVNRMVVDEMTGSYFARDPKAMLPWFKWAKENAPGCVLDEPESFCARPKAKAEASAPDAPKTDASRAEDRAKRKRASRSGRFQRIRQQLATPKHAAPPWRSGLDPDPSHLCDGTDGISQPAERIADAMRFENSLARVFARAAAWCDEGIIDCGDPKVLEANLNAGFDHAARYLLEDRQWRRDARRASVGLVLSGGASNGMFSAGATWQMLEIVDKCLHAEKGKHQKDCADLRFQLISGTSAGSMVAALVDLYNAQYEGVDHALDRKAQDAFRNRLIQWFTCLPAEQLYCANDAWSASLFTSRTGIADFDGIRVLLGKYATTGMLKNSSELFLNTVDFQSGYLLAPSDQDREDTKDKCDLVEHALSSIPEPLVANAIQRLRLGGFTDADGGVPDGGVPGFFLDGGVLSVLPLMPVIRHGADRVVMVSNGPSIVSGSRPPGNSFDLLQRYIDISVNGAGADGVTLATSFAEVRRGSEQGACLEFFRSANGKASCTDPPCTTFCAGDIYQACSGTEDAASTLGQERSFPMISIYRDDAKVDPAAGYSFAPAQSYPMFLAGANAVRERCLEIASLLGATEEWSKDILGFCQQTIPPANQKSRCAGVDEPAGKIPAGVRACPSPALASSCPAR